jgi:mannose-6-phosphate isomerase-like protein (cupin superfamily)
MSAKKAHIDVLTGNISEITINNNNYRKVINTTRHQQLVLMSLKPKEEIGMEMHEKIDQFFHIEKGSAIAIIGKDEHKTYKLKKEHFITIPAGTYHNIINIGKGELKLYTIYSPSNHKSGTIQKVKPKND